jgi:hypothetical protein
LPLGLFSTVTGKLPFLVASTSNGFGCTIVSEDWNKPQRPRSERRNAAGIPHSPLSRRGRGALVVCSAQLGSLSFIRRSAHTSRLLPWCGRPHPCYFATSCSLRRSHRGLMLMRSAIAGAVQVRLLKVAAAPPTTHIIHRPLVRLHVASLTAVVQRHCQRTVPGAGDLEASER